MRINKIKLDDIRSYDNSSASFEDGLILVYGDNGAGKSSLLSSIFGSLYFSSVMDYMDADINLDSIVRRKADEGSISIDFSINGDEYNVEWVISVKEEDGERTASTKSCTLTGSSMNQPVDGVRDVREAIRNIIGMDAESFVNSVYVQQGDINRVIESDGSKRKEIIDGLLGLSKLDQYNDRMDKVRLEFGSQKRQIDGLLEEKQRRRKNLPDVPDIKSKISDLESELEDIKNRINKVDTGISDLEDEKSDVKERLEKYEKNKDEYEKAKRKLQEIEDKRDEIIQKKKETEDKLKVIEAEIEATEDVLDEKSSEHGHDTDRNTIEEKHESKKESLSELKEEITEIKKVKIKNTNSDIDRLKKEIASKNSEIDNIKENIESKKDKLSSLKDEVGDLEQSLDLQENSLSMKMDKIEDLCDLLNIEFKDIDELEQDEIPNARQNIIDRIAEVHEELGYTKRSRDVYEELLDGNESVFIDNLKDNVEDEVEEKISKKEEEVDEVRGKTEAIREQKEHLDELSQHINSVRKIQNKIQNQESKLESKFTRIEEIKESIEEYSSNVKTLNEQIEQKENEIEQKEEELDNYNSELELKNNIMDNLQSEIDKYKRLLSSYETIDELDQKITSVEKDIEKYDELKSEKQSQHLTKLSAVEELEDSIEGYDPEDDRETIEDKNQRIKKLKGIKEDEESKLEEKQLELASKRQELEQIKEINERCRELEHQKLKAAEKEREAEEIMSAYQKVKTRLRKENIGLLNKYSNEVFQSVYQNKVYQKLEIDKDYNIRLITGDGVKIRPEDLSGGEKTLLSLSIRAGVYKLLVERQGNADTLPPFILDEPTTFLDDGHVSNLQNVIDTITSWDVPQVFVVSHKEDMIQNADSAYEVVKEASTETSDVQKRY